MAVRFRPERLAVTATTIVAAHVGVLQIARRPVARDRPRAVVPRAARLLDQRRALLGERLTRGQVLGAVEILATLDPGLLAMRVRRERAAVPDREIGVL